MEGQWTGGLDRWTDGSQTAVHSSQMTVHSRKPGLFLDAQVLPVNGKQLPPGC